MPLPSSAPTEIPARTRRWSPRRNCTAGHRHPWQAAIPARRTRRRGGTGGRETQSVPPLRPEPTAREMLPSSTTPSGAAGRHRSAVSTRDEHGGEGDGGPKRTTVMYFPPATSVRRSPPAAACRRTNTHAQRSTGCKKDWVTRATELARRNARQGLRDELPGRGPRRCGAAIDLSDHLVRHLMLDRRTGIPDPSRWIRLRQRRFRAMSRVETDGRSAQPGRTATRPAAPFRCRSGRCCARP